MADNNLARNRNDDPDNFADGDPLAELARIVGYDERLVPKPPVAERREPAFNLEDELLQEFERYEAPRPHQSLQPPLVSEPRSAAAEDNMPVGQPAAFDKGQIAEDDTAELDWSAVEDVFADAFPKAEAGTATVEPLIDLGAPQGDVEPIDWHAERAAPLEPFADEPSAERVEPAFFAEDAIVTAAEPDRAEAVEESVLDLADELELALGEPDVARMEPVPQAHASRSDLHKRGYTPGFRMPLANFNLSRDVLPQASRAEPVVETPAVVEQSAPDIDAHEPADVRIETVAVKSEPAVAAPVEAAAASSTLSSELSALDALIGDVSRYPVPNTASSIENRGEQTRPVLQPDVMPAVQLVAAKIEPVKVPEPVRQQTAQPLDPMIDDEFELALDDLDLDLSDILSDEDLMSEPQPAAPSRQQSQPVAPVIAPMEPVRHTASWSPVARFVPSQARSSIAGPAIPPAAAAVSAATVAPAPVAQPAPVMQATPAASPETIADLPFDPSLITESEEHVEPVMELDVPELHVETQEQAPVYRNDYDYDIDSELASLLQSSAAASAVEEPEAVQPTAAAPQAVQPPVYQVAQQGYQQAAKPAVTQSYPDLDDFERALEEDFRRSLTTPLPQQSDIPDAGARSAGRAFEGSRRSLSAMVVPLAVAGVVIAGGSIAYMLFGGDGSSVASNGEPVVIAADTDPVKVLPENPGGKTVPNQDKAVYDRVAGAAMETPKQESLISTNEEPIDVVQKTLMSDMLPLEGRADAADALAAGQQDDRLPSQGEQIAGLDAEPDQQSVAVTPRRVKTMIVRPDGTLVEQEVPVSAAPAVAANAPAAADKAPAAPTRTDMAAAPATAAGQPADVAGIVPAGVDTSVEDIVAAASAQTGGPSSAATPVPTARPSAQPVNVVAAVTDQGNVRAAPAAQPAQQQQAAAPAAQAAAVPPGGYVIQIASLPSEADAQKSYQSLSSKFGSVIGGRGVDIKMAQIEGKGTFYRVRIPAGSKDDAVALCEKYRSAGGSCLVAR